MWSGSTVPFINYHLLGLSPEDRLQPFIGGFVGATYNDDDITGVIGPNVGLKYFVHDNTFIVARYRYEWAFEEFDVFEEGADGNHVGTVGIGFVWR